MMTLLVDSGNRSIKWAVLEKGDLVEHGRVDRSSGESLSDVWKHLRQPQRVLVSNVAGQPGEEMVREISIKLWQLPVEIVSSTDECCGVTNCYVDPAKLGVDRWLAMIAAWHMTEGPVIVIDCGTAVTIDLVDENGAFRGGIIMAGLGLSRVALRAGTASLDKYDQSHLSVAAKSTAEAVTSGTLIGLAGAIERVVKDQSEMLEMKPSVLLCGGDAENLMMLLNINVEIQPDMVLQGLRVCCEAGEG